MKKKATQKEHDLPLAYRAEEALIYAVTEEIADHKRTGHPVVSWRDGKVVKIPPDEIPEPYDFQNNEIQKKDGAMGKVFISYVPEDTETARKLYNDLKQWGIELWFDKEDLLPGQKWKDEIRKAIKDSSFVLALLSSKSVSEKGHYHKELKTAFDTRDECPSSEIFIIPVRLDDCKPSDERIRELSWVDLFSSYENGLRKILKVLKPDIPMAREPNKAADLISDIGNNLVLQKGLIDISQDVKYTVFDFIAYRDTRASLKLFAIVKADSLSKKTITELRNKFFELTGSLHQEFDFKKRGRNPNGLLCFVFENRCTESLIQFIQKQTKISHWAGGVIVSWVIDLETSRIHTHKNPVSLVPPVILLADEPFRGFNYAFPGLKYLEGFLT